MADYPNSKLDKALALRAASSTTRAAWQEWMARHSTVPSFAIQAPDVLQGFSGSWAAQYGLDDSVKGTAATISPAQVQRQVNHLGLPGLAEISFRPYDWGTTRHGKYGPSLLGHPVSFEVVGPTAKSPQLFHQWVLDSSGAQDILTLDTITWRSTVAVPETLYASVDDIPEIYGISSIPEEGLYLVVSMTGHKGHLDDVGGGVSGVGGLGDGTIGQKADGLNPRTAISTPNSGVGQKAKFEIFRVEDMDATSLTLAAGKRISDFFTVPGGTAIIRAVTLIKPAAARLVAVPGSGERGKEQVFAFVPPEKALTSDLLPPAALWDLGACDPWLNYNASTTGGATADYDQKVALPVPRPIRQGTGRLQGVFGEIPVSLTMGRLLLVLDASTTFSASDVGKVVRICAATRYQDGNWSTATVDGGSRVGDPELDRLLGYWVIEEATAGAPDSYSVRMVPQVDPLTGVPFLGSSEFMQMAQGDLVAGKEVRLQWTLHDPVSTLWTDRHLQADKLDSARLRGLIDPSWVKPTNKNIDLLDAEASSARPDRAAFNTTTGEDPGSLMDLGFRPVFYPAKASVTDPTKLVPDYENPITSNELVLDPTLPTEKQWLEVDYSAGLVSLSHPPKVGIGCQLVPDSLTLANASNPRREVVFFASFVPFSQEPGQRGVTPRVTGGQVVTRVGSACEDASESIDVYGTRLHWPLASGQTITSGTAFQIKLDVQLDAIDLPPTGFIELVSGANEPLGSPGWVDGSERRVSTFGYTSVIYSDAGNGGNTTLEGCFGGGVNGDAITTTPLTTRLTAVLRRDVVSPNRGDGSTGTDFQSDTTYGSGKRGAALRFKRATTTMEPDGSLTVDTRDPLTTDHQALFQDLYSSWVIQGGELTNALPDPVLEFSELTVLISGVRSVLPAQSVSPSAFGRYVYIDGTNPQCPVYDTTASLPLPSAQDVLLGQYTWIIFSGTVGSYTDLRHPMVDLDKRLDITVGAPVGFDQPAEAHFDTLAKAVDYVKRTTRPTSGDFGKYRRIKVIGPTVEDNATLPIQPKIQGLIIEGAGRAGDGTTTDLQEITWRGAAAPALFDLSGCDGLVIRNVNFRYDAQATVSVVARERSLFTADETVGGNVVSNVVIENVTLQGPAHGFLYVNNDLDLLTGYSRVTLRQCTALDVTDFGVYVNGLAPTIERLHVLDCHFGGSLTTGTESLIQGNWLSDNLAAGSNSSVAYNHIDAGAGNGDITASANSTYTGNVAAGNFLGATASGCFLANNRFNGAGSNYGGLGTTSHGDSFAGKFVFKSTSVFEGCGFDDGIDNNGILTSEQCVFTGCAITFAATSSVLVEKAVFKGNTIVSTGVDITVGFDGIDNSFIGNQFAGNLTVKVFETAASARTGLVVQGNIFRRTGVAVECGLEVQGDFCLVEGNLVEGVETTPGSLGIRVGGPGGVNAGAHNTIIGNILGRPGVAVGLGCNVTESVVSGNRVFGALTTSVNTHNTTIADNVLGEEGVTTSTMLNVAAGVGLSVTGNVVEGDVLFTATDSVFSSNRISDTVTLAGAGTLYSDNHITNECTFSGVASKITGNFIGGACDLSGNSSIFSGNDVGGDFTLTGTECLISACIIRGAVDLDADDTTCVGCRLGAGAKALAAHAPRLNLKDNTVLGESGLGGSTSVSIQNIVGNHFQGLVTLFAPWGLRSSSITGNTFDAAVTFSPAHLYDCTVSGNVFQSTFDCSDGSRNIFTGNRHDDNVTLTNQDNSVVQGNLVGTTAFASKNLDLTGSTNYVCTGNNISGTLFVDDSGGTAGEGVVVGNRAAVIATNNAPNAGTVVVGNRTVNAGGNTNFNTAPGAGPVIASNVEG